MTYVGSGFSRTYSTIAFARVRLKADPTYGPDSKRLYCS